MDHREPRAVLGLPRGATREDAQRAFRRLAKQTHPDAGGDAAEFRVVADAWAALGPVLPPKPRPAVVAPHLAAYRPAASRIVWAERRPPVRPARRHFAAVLEAEVTRLAG